MLECYTFEKEINKEELINKYKNIIISNQKYDNELKIEQIAISDEYIIYPKIDGLIKNLKYLIDKNNNTKNGSIDISYSIISNLFILNELKTSNFKISDKNIDEYSIYNKEDIEKYDKLFIDKIIDKAKLNICKRHNFIYTSKNNYLDISPIKDFKELNKKYFLEKVYILSYFSKKSKRNYKSIYSVYKNDFYLFEYELSDIYKKFIKKYKRPIVYIPKNYLNKYYDLAFNIFLKTEEELKYISYNDLYNKILKNIKYKEYNCYEDYLNKLIFYYRKKKYLKEYKNNNSNLINNIFYYYLTLKYNSESGYNLAELVDNNIIDGDYTVFLKISEKLGNNLARKKLYEYYLSPKYYDENNLKRYS